MQILDVQRKIFDFSKSKLSNLMMIMCYIGRALHASMSGFCKMLINMERYNRGYALQHVIMNRFFMVHSVEADC